MRAAAIPEQAIASALESRGCSRRIGIFSSSTITWEFGTKNQSLTGIGAGAGFTYAGNIKQDVDKVLVGLNYRFDAWGKAPVVAKY